MITGCTNDDFDYYGADGHKIILKNNADAVDVTYNELVTFIKMDNTDEIPFNEDTFSCGDYAERLHNNAEAAGINCGFVVLYFDEEDFPYACNVFRTLDEGLVFIDCSGVDTIVDFLNDPNLIYSPEPIDRSEYGIILILPLGCVRDYEIYWE